MDSFHPERWALFALQKLRTVANDSSLVIASILSDILARARAGGSAVTKALVPVELTTQAASYRSNVNSFIEIYAADKGAPPDYALLSVGAKVLSSSPSMARLYIRFLRNYIVALFPASNIAYMPTPPNSPSIAFMPDITPGNCWAFPGHKGSVTVRLARPIAPTAITIEHTPRSSVFSISSAPRDFAVYVLPLAPSGFPDDSDKTGVLVGRFRYDTSPSAGHLQTFRLARRILVARAIRIEILSNHGSRTHTCLYRVRVHGKPMTDRESFPNEADILQ
jgi:SUN domain-containing protein 1/2